MSETPKKMGRPTKFTNDMMYEICERLAMGEPISKITKDSHMPHMSNIYRWLKENAEFRELYETARADGAHTYASQIVELIDEEPKVIFDDNGNAKYDTGSIAWRRLQMDGRKWVAAKYLPKVYGDRQILAGDEENPVAVKDVTLFDELVKNLELTRQKKKG